MKPIGGFFELELPPNGKPYHTEAVALSTGRACLSLMIEILRPKKVFVPFYTCNATLDPFKKYGINIEFYALDSLLKPIELPKLKEGEFFLQTNYFGLMRETNLMLTKHYGNKLLIDNTHDFFHKEYKGVFSFTSARKYFGVPDGAFLYLPQKIDTSFERFQGIKIEHNFGRLQGDESAFRKYQQYEASLNSDINGISLFSERMLNIIPFEDIENKRIQNFNFLNSKLGSMNTFNFTFESTHSPFCYPFLPEKGILKEKFYQEKIFPPTLWADTLHRNVTGFTTAKKMTENLIPLPIDHRYDEIDMNRIVNFIQQQ